MITYNLASNIRTTVAMDATVNSNTTTAGAIIDVDKTINGPVFVVEALAYTDGTYNFEIFESDDSNMATENKVDDDQLVGNIADLEINSGPSAEGDIVKRVGVFGTKRYVRLKVVSTGVTTGARITALVIQPPSIVPSSE